MDLNLKGVQNPHFNYPEFGVIENEAGVNSFIMSVGQWIKRTNAMGLIVKAKRFGGTCFFEVERLQYMSCLRHWLKF
jgi:hypothetical protein